MSIYYYKVVLFYKIYIFLIIPSYFIAAYTKIPATAERGSPMLQGFLVLYYSIEISWHWGNRRSNRILQWRSRKGHSPYQRHHRPMHH